MGSSFTIPTPYTQVQQPAWVAAPASSDPFFWNSWVNLPAMGQTVAILTFIVPQNRSGVINGIGNEFVGGGWNSGDGNLVWQLFRNRVPIKNASQILSTLGTVTAPSRISPIRLRANDTIQLALTNIGVNAAGQRLGGRLDGYYYPTDLDPEEIF